MKRSEHELKEKRSKALDEGEKQEAEKGAHLLEYSDLNCGKSYTQEAQQPEMLMSDQGIDSQGQVMDFQAVRVKCQAQPSCLRVKEHVGKKK